MRYLVLLAFLAGVAHADTITLNTTPCGVNLAGGCTVYQAGALGASDYITLNWTAPGALTVRFFAHDPDTGMNTLTDEYNGAVGYPVAVVGQTIAFSDVALTDSVGAVVFITGSFRDTRKCVQSGRGQTCTNQVVFMGGMLTQ